MKTVGIKMLKNHLSHYLKEVRSGEVVRVTDHDEVIAEIHRPTTRPPARLGRWEKWMNSQECSGSIRRAKSAGPSLRTAQTLPAPATPVELAVLLDQTRADRSG